MTFSKRESRLFVAMCGFDVGKSVSLFLLTAQLCDDENDFWRHQLPENMKMSTSLSDLLLIAVLRVSLLCGICEYTLPAKLLGRTTLLGMTQSSCSADVSDGAARHVALSVAYISFRILTLAGSIYLAMKLAFYDYDGLGNSGATACAVLMIVGSLVALWVESVIPYVLTAARITGVDDSESLVCLLFDSNVHLYRFTDLAVLLFRAQLPPGQAMAIAAEQTTEKLAEPDTQKAAAA